MVEHDVDVHVHTEFVNDKVVHEVDAQVMTVTYGVT